MPDRHERADNLAGIICRCYAFHALNRESLRLILYGALSDEVQESARDAALLRQAAEYLPYVRPQTRATAKYQEFSQRLTARIAELPPLETEAQSA